MSCSNKTKSFNNEFTHCISENKSEHMRITFIATDKFIMTRVIKMASAARYANIKLQLILCFNPEDTFKIDAGMFEEIVSVSAILDQIADVFTAISAFGSSLCHVFVGCAANLEATLLILGLPLPVVGDPYDLCCAQYISWKNEKARQLNDFYESLWFKVVDGICIRNHYLKTKEFLSIYERGKPIYYAPDPARKTLCTRNTDNIDPSKINIMVDGMGSSDEAHMAAFDEMLHITQTNKNFNFFIYRSEYDFSRMYGPNVHTFPCLDSAKYNSLMRSCDAFMIPWAYDYVKRAGYSDNLRLSTRSTTTDILEADIINITPDYFELTGKNTLKCGRAIIFSQKDQQSYEFWNSLPQRVAQMRSVASNVHRFLDTTIGPHLRPFYQRSVAYAEKNAVRQSNVRAAILRALQNL